MAGAFGGQRGESLRRLAELTGLGIAASYFLDPEHGADRRRAAGAWIARVAGPTGREAALQETVLPAAAPEPAAPEPVEPEPPLTVVHEAVVLRPADDAAQAGRAESAWPRWGWALVIAVTICALAAFAAIGVGIWAVERNDSGSTPAAAAPPGATVTPAALAVLADPSARRVPAATTRGEVLLVVRPTGAAALVVSGVRPPSAGHLYRVWLKHGTSTSPAGRFGRGRAVVALPVAATAGDQVVVTEEPAASQSSAPHGPVAARVDVPSGG